MGLEAFIAERKQDKDLLVMAHVVCGYPSFEDNMQELEIMAEAGVDLVELLYFAGSAGGRVGQPAPAIC